MGVDGELPIVPQRRLNQPVIVHGFNQAQIRTPAMFQPRTMARVAFNRSTPRKAGTCPRTGVLTRVMPQLASDTARGNGAASDTY